MTQIATEPAGPIDAAKLEQEIRAKIESLSYLPTTVAVAMKFVELGKDPKAEPSDYAKVISADSSLSSKLLALANSPWFGVRHKVTTVKHAVNLLGLGTVRTMAISYCMAGLHNELRLTPDESRMFWEASLCKAVAAKQYAKLVNDKLADEAFVGGMLQDFALPVMYASAKEQLVSILQDSAADWQTQLDKERQVFRLDHTEIGRILAQKLQLPDLYIDAVAFHHSHDRLSDFMEHEAVGDGIYAASLFPHVLNAWNRNDAEELCRFLGERAQCGISEPAAFLEEVQKQFDQVYHYFEGGNPPETRLAELMIQAAKEEADNTASLVKTANQLMQEAASVGMEMNQLLQDHSKLENKASRDQLTGVLNREGFTDQANDLLAKVARYGMPFALVYLDVDRFKSINDTLGHEFGDRALKSTAARMTEATRQHDLVGRMGGDEFVLLLCDCKEPDAQQIAQRILTHVAAEPVRKGKQVVTISLSAGLLYVRASNQEHSFDALLRAADKLMYLAKQAGGNQVHNRIL